MPATSTRSSTDGSFTVRGRRPPVQWGSPGEDATPPPRLCRLGRWRPAWRPDRKPSMRFPGSPGADSRIGGDHGRGKDGWSGGGPSAHPLPAAAFGGGWAPSAGRRWSLAGLYGLADAGWGLPPESPRKPHMALRPKSRATAGRVSPCHPRPRQPRRWSRGGPVHPEAPPGRRAANGGGTDGRCRSRRPRPPLCLERRLHREHTVWGALRRGPGRRYWRWGSPLESGELRTAGGWRPPPSSHPQEAFTFERLIPAGAGNTAS